MSGHHKKDVGAVVRKSGVDFRVWAPNATNVAVTGSFNDWQTLDMTDEGDGYWAVFAEGAQAGQEYRYVVTNGDQVLSRTDPRALQMTTAAGNAVVVDTHFDWADDGFELAPLDAQVLYELHIGTFHRSDPSTIGTFADAMEKLDYLAALGITTIELMPIATMSPLREFWGYTAMYLYAVESQYGGRHQFLEFVNAAHQKGMAVVLDVVYNHLGPMNFDMWQFDGWQKNGKGGIYFYNDWRSNTPWGDTRLDYGRPEVRDYVLDNVRMWLHDCHVDGLRADSTIFIRNAKGNNDAPDTDLPDGWSLLRDINKLARKIDPGALTIAEDVGSNDYLTKPVSDGGAGFSSQWETGFPHALRDALWTNDPTKLNLEALFSELPKSYNGDPFQRIIYIDSHDTAANGSARLNEVIAPHNATNLFARRQSLLAAVLLMTAPGVPMMLQGQEFMMDGSFSDWEALDWERVETYDGIVEAYRQLIGLRKNTGDMSAGLTGWGMKILQVDDENKVVVYHRWRDGGPRDDVVVVLNFGNRKFDTYSASLPHDGTWRVRFCSAHKGYSPDFAGTSVPDVEVQGGQGAFVLPAATALILSQD